MSPTIRTHEQIEWNANGQRVRTVYREDIVQVDANTQVTVSYPVSVEVLPEDWQAPPAKPKEVKDHV